MRDQEEPLRVAILGSGAGSIARAIVENEHTRDGCPHHTVVLVTTRTSGGFHDISKEHGVPCETLRGRGPEGDAQLLDLLTTYRVDLLVLAGYMRLISPQIIEAMNGRVINTHPALLPKFGGKGMYGQHVHRAVLEAGEAETGATIHWVTENYDEGSIIAQQSLQIRADETMESLELRVKNLEKHLMVRTISELSQNRCN